MKKKKKEEPEIYHTPFGSTTVKPPEYDLSHYSIEPETMEVTSKNSHRETIPTSMSLPTVFILPTLKHDRSSIPQLPIPEN